MLFRSQGQRPLRPNSERFLFVLSKRNPSDYKEKTALVRVVGGGCLLWLPAYLGWSSRRRMALYNDGRALLRFARGTAAQKPRGQGGEAPNKRRDKHPRPKPREPRPWAGSARPAHLARPRPQARAAYPVPFCPAKWDTLEKPRQVSGRNLPSIGMAARTGRPKSPRGFASGRYLILRL